MKVKEIMNVLEKLDNGLEVTDIRILPKEVANEGQKKSILDQKRERLFVSIEDEDL